MNFVVQTTLMRTFPSKSEYNHIILQVNLHEIDQKSSRDRRVGHACCIGSRNWMDSLRWHKQQKVEEMHITFYL
jgi:hypothetical protein